MDIRVIENVNDNKKPFYEEAKIDDHGKRV